MVCGREQSSGSAISGGFVLVNVASLMAAWWACQSRPLGAGDFRSWLALREMVARRCVLKGERAPSYGFPELARLLGVTEKRAKVSIARLVAAGLLEWSESAIVFLDHVLGDQDLVEDSIGGGRGSVAIPRRMLRLLAGGARPALIATALGVLLRCLSRRKGGFEGRGRVKASWIAEAFGVDLRRVKASRLELGALGWISPEPSGHRAENRWGRAYRVDLAWDRAKAGGRSLPPLPALEGSAIATPSVNLDPLPERERNQEPASGRPAGASLEGTGGRDQDLPAPRLADVRLEDLKDTGRLLELHGQAVAEGVVSTSEADRLRFAGAAEHALAVGKTNPAGLFAYLVRGKLWRYLTGADEDRAGERLKVHRRGPTPIGPAAPRGPSVSDDARVVREVRAATIRAGIFRDPWPAFARLHPEWSRDRWDLAMVEIHAVR